jgi:hypothetical protein
MADYKFAIHALMEAAQANMAEAGFSVPHLFGEKHRTAHGTPPRYVWIPDRIRDRNGSISTQVQEYRTLFSFQAHFFIDCWGADFDHASALMEAVSVACHRAAFADFAIESGEWHSPSKGWAQPGEMVRLECSLGVPIPDRYPDAAILNVAFKPDLAETIPDPDAPTVLLARVDGAMHLTSDVDEDGEKILDVSTSP